MESKIDYYSLGQLDQPLNYRVFIFDSTHHHNPQDLSRKSHPLKAGLLCSFKLAGWPIGVPQNQEQVSRSTEPPLVCFISFHCSSPSAYNIPPVCMINLAASHSRLNLHLQHLLEECVFVQILAVINWHDLLLLLHLSSTFRAI